MGEKAFRKGHNYLTLVNDLRGSRVLYVAEDREQKSLDGFWGTLTEEQRAGAQAFRQPSLSADTQILSAIAKDIQQRNSAERAEQLLNYCTADELVLLSLIVHFCCEHDRVPTLQ